MAVLYQQAYQDMLTLHRDQFAAFKAIHDKFKADPDNWKSKFDELGIPVVRIIGETENRLCAKMENSNRSKYAANLAEKFRSVVKVDYPLIDLVGVTIA